MWFTWLLCITAIVHPLCITCQEIVRLPSNKLHITFSAFDRKYILDLRPNQFLSANYQERTSDKRHTRREQDWCHYRGTVHSVSSSWAALSYCAGLLNGLFQENGTVFHLVQSEPNTLVKLFTDVNSNDNNYHCGFQNSLVNDSKISRFRRELDQPDKKLFDATRYVELVLVNDYKVFAKYSKNIDYIFERSKQIANIVNSLYSPLNILIALVGVVVWTEKNEINITHDSSQTLNNFLKYRRDILIKQFPSNDNAQLITGTSFESGIVGKALKQTMCTYEYSGGVNSDYSENANLVATTIAHELGHNFGMEHDTNNCQCAGKNCIMGPSSSMPSPRHWSSCSLKQITDSFKHGIDHCLFNKPQVIFKPSCGNGLVDDGEQCDCGLPESCTNPCCNATTCQLTAGAQCANGPCCDQSTCRVKPSGHVCRHNKSVCDLVEVCDGTSEHCPQDLTVKDGTECLKGYAYCHAGLCNTRENQCKLLWGETSEVADYRCYQHNNNASSSGNCGYDKQRKKFISCDSTRDIICGRLHCTRLNEKLEYGPEGAAIISKSVEIRKKNVISCYSAIIDLGLYQMDPGLVPNGAKCGTNSMCVDQKCVPVAKYLLERPCPYNCNGNGHCDNEGNCHCFEGFHSPDCSAYANRYYITITIYILFLLVFPLLSLGAFLFYHNQQKLKSWFRQKTLSSHGYNNQKRKKLPNNLQISGPVHNAVQQSVSTFSANNAQVVATKDAVVLKPIRPAPPRPQVALQTRQQNSPRPQSPTQIELNGLQQLHSLHGDVDDKINSLHKTSSVRRPKVPPPLPPSLPSVCDNSHDQSEPPIKRLIERFENGSKGQ